MSISAIRLIVLVLEFVAFSATAADALFRSGLESSICDTSAAEFEPNDTAATAESVTLDPTTASAMICGANNGGDADWFHITITGTSTALIETIRADGAPCAPAYPMSLALFGSAAITPIASDTKGGVGGCASLDGVTSSMLQSLTPGSYYIKVFSDVLVPVYALSIRLL